MFVLKSIHLRNFGAVSDSTFTPAETGMTSIYGANGNGKSSFLDAVIWALFGVLPREKKQSDMRNFKAPDDEKTTVTVVFEHEGDTISVTRSMNKRGTVTADVALNDSGSPMTKTTPTTAVTWIKKRLGINEEGFTKAFAIKQKELDDLVNATPAKRREIIERISGVDKMSLALKSAKDSEKEARIRYEGYHDPTEEVKALETVIRTAEEAFESLSDDLEAVTMETEMKKRDAERASSLWKKLHSKKRDYERAVEAIASAKKERDNAEASVERYTATLDSLASDSSEKSKEDVESEFSAAKEKAGKIRADIQREQDSLDALVKQSAQRESRIASLDNACSQAREAVERAESRRAELEGRLQGDLKNAGRGLTPARKKVDEATAVVHENTAAVMVKQNLIATHQKAIDSLTSLGDDHTDTCPTCSQKLAEPEKFVKNLKQEQAEAEQDVTRLEAEGRKAVEKLESEKAKLDEIESRIAEKEQVSDELTALSGQVESLTAEQKQNEEALKAAQEEKVPLVDRSRLTSLQEELESLLDEGRKLQSVRENFDRIDTARKNLETEQARAQDLREQVISLETELPESVDDASMEEAERNQEERQRALEGQAEKEKKLYQDYYGHKTTVDVKKAELEALRADSEKRDEARRLWESRAATSHMIAEFRKDTISRIAPEIAASTSAVVSSMTSDEFVGINLDSDFTPSVVRADGREDPVSFLSGGEKSLVALSMLIGIGELLSGGSGGLLWLDEALVSQDASRRNLIASTLRNLHNRQVVMVNHTPDGNDLSDVVVELVKGDAGSYLRYE